MVGVVRDKTQAYLRLRRGPLARGGGGLSGDVEMLELNLHAGPGQGLDGAIAPTWTTTVAQVRLLMDDADAKITALARLHDDSLMEVFDNKEQDKAIEMLTAEITGYFRKLKKMIKDLGELKVDEQSMVVKGNVQKELAMRLQGKTTEFRQRQSIFLSRLQKKKQTGSKYDIGSAAAALDYEEDVVDPGFNQQQMNILKSRQRLADARSQEVEEIHRSIVELADIFQEMAAIVVEQGTILDRIDFNIERTSHNVKEAVKELEKGYKYQKSSRTKLILLVVLLLVVGVMIAVMVRLALAVINPF